MIGYLGLRCRQELITSEVQFLLSKSFIGSVDAGQLYAHVTSGRIVVDVNQR